jgi:PAS domain S-box-containing protein
MKQLMKTSTRNTKKTTAKKTQRRRTAAAIASSGAVIGDIHKFIELLQINQIELEHQNEELRITEEELQESRNKYVNLFDFSPIPYFALDRDGNIKKVNISGAKMIGMDRSRLIDKPFIAYVLPEEKGIFSAMMKQVFASTEKVTCKLTMVSKDKRVCYVLMEGVQLENGIAPGQRCQIALIDLTEYEKLNTAYNELNEKYKALKASRV